MAPVPVTYTPAPDTDYTLHLYLTNGTCTCTCYRLVEMEHQVREVKLLEHTARCHDRSCSVPGCLAMRRLVVHTRECRRMKAVCPTCRTLLNISTNHASSCMDHRCPVPHCLALQHRRRQQGTA